MPAVACPNSHPVALTIGNFDGVHLGHAALIQAARQAVTGHGTAGGRVIAVTFEPHPMAVLKPGAEPARLSTIDQRRRWLVEAGADAVVVVQPTREYLNQSPRAFLRELTAEHRPKFIVEGDDFHFGHKRSGTIQTLRELEKEFGYRTIVVDWVERPLADQALARANSSMIRWLVQHGRVADAATLLGRPYELCGPVVRGDQRGRTIGMPTINIDHGQLLLPADGIYAGDAVLPDGSTHRAAISVGTKPTFAGDRPRVCEAHLINWHGPLDSYGWIARIHFRNWLRDQLVYRDVNGLIDQLQRDIRMVRSSSALRTS